METAAIVLAAGAGTRMKSKKPKVAHCIFEKPMVRWVIDAAKAAGASRIVTVVGHGADQVRPLVETDTQVAVQREMRGTADAVAAAGDAMAGVQGSVLVLSGDCPLITPETLRRLVEYREELGAACVVLGMRLENPFGYGRILRAGWEEMVQEGVQVADSSQVMQDSQEVLRIVEQKDGTAEELAVVECNSGFYCFDVQLLFEALGKVENDNAQGEYYLTDVLEILREGGHKVMALFTDDPQECAGVNSRIQLAEATRAMQQRINVAHLMNGVTMIDPDQVWIGPDVRIAQDVSILPQVSLMGATVIGEDSVIGPNTRLTDTQVGCRCTVDETVAIEAKLEDDVKTGPRAYLRPGTHMLGGSKAGTHVEIKKSTVGPNSKVPHLSYIGDATIGADVNIGAGSITCNYDGANKHATTIGDRSFIGSDTMMVAPVNIGANTVVGAGSVITKDIPDGALAVARSREKIFDGWTERHSK